MVLLACPAELFACEFAPDPDTDCGSLKDEVRAVRPRKWGQGRVRGLRAAAGVNLVQRQKMCGAEGVEGAGSGRVHA